MLVWLKTKRHFVTIRIQLFFPRFVKLNYAHFIRNSKTLKTCDCNCETKRHTDIIDIRVFRSTSARSNISVRFEG